MRAAVIVLGAAALAVAGGTGLMLSRYMDRAQAETKVVQPKARVVGVLVAADALPVGRVIDGSALAWQEWPEGAARAAAAHGVVHVAAEAARSEAANAFAGAVVRAAMVRGEPVTEAKLARPEGASLLSAVLSPGMRTVTLGVDVTAGAGGMLQPGDRVDVMLTADLPDPNAGQVDPRTGRQNPRYVTETILRDMKVLTVDRNLAAADAAPDAPIPTNVTLEATPRQAEQVATALRVGRLTLALRPLRGGEAPRDPGPAVTTDLQVMRGLAAERAGVDPERLGDASPFARRATGDRARGQVTIYRWTEPTEVAVPAPVDAAVAPAAGRAQQK